MNSYPGAKDINSLDYAFEGPTKQKPDLPPRCDCDSHQPDKVNHSIPHPDPKGWTLHCRPMK